MTTRPTRALRLLLAASLPVLGPPAVAQGAPADAVLKDFEPIGDYLLQVDGEEVPEADMYLSQVGGARLLVTDTGASPPLLISPRERTVEAVPEEALIRRDDGAVDLRADARLEPVGSLQVDGGVVSFDFGEHRGALEPRPPLLGLVGPDELREYSSSYGYLARQYSPSGPMLRQLEAQSTPVRVRVYFGTWCPFCKQMVPNILKVAEELDGSAFDFEFYGLPRSFGNEPEAASADIHSVPTAVVYLGGEEVGRITGSQWKIPELALKQLLTRTGG